MSATIQCQGHIMVGLLNDARWTTTALKYLAPPALLLMLGPVLAVSSHGHATPAAADPQGNAGSFGNSALRSSLRVQYSSTQMRAMSCHLHMVLAVLARADAGVLLLDSPLRLHHMQDISVRATYIRDRPQ